MVRRKLNIELQVLDGEVAVRVWDEQLRQAVRYLLKHECGDVVPSPLMSSMSTERKWWVVGLVADAVRGYGREGKTETVGQGGEVAGSGIDAESDAG